LYELWEVEMTKSLADLQEDAAFKQRTYIHELEEINIQLRIQLDEAIKRVNELEVSLMAEKVE
jgi:RNase P subunit RPR2